jgi:hypothetical protein
VVGGRSTPLLETATTTATSTQGGIGNINNKTKDLKHSGLEKKSPAYYYYFLYD